MSTITATECIKRVLLEAARIMRVGGILRGLRRYHYELPGQGPHCLLGAIDDAIILMEAQASCTGWLPDEINRRAVEATCLLLPQPTNSDEDIYNDKLGDAILETPSLHCAWWSNIKAADGNEVAAKLEEAASALGATAP